MNQSVSDVINKEEIICCHCNQRIKPGEKCVMFTQELKTPAKHRVRYEHMGEGMPAKRYYDDPLVWHEHCFIQKELARMTKFIMK